MVKGDETFEMWKTPEPAVYLKVYIFNITNREDFLSGRDEKLRFQEVGPYVYRCVMNVKLIFKNKNYFRRRHLMYCESIIYIIKYYIPEKGAYWILQKLN